MSEEIAMSAYKKAKTADGKADANTASIASFAQQLDAHMADDVTKANVIQTTEVNDSTKVPSSAVTYAINQALKRGLIGEIKLRSTASNALPSVETDNPSWYKTNWGNNSLTISDLVGQYDGTWGVLITIVGTITTDFVVQIAITTSGGIKTRGGENVTWNAWKTVTTS